MKRKRKPITRALIQKYFGKDAKVFGFAGHYRVTTPTGGEVTITSDKMKLVYGGDDVHRAMTLLIGECWGYGKASGSREYMLASVAHGEAWGVNIQPDFRNRGATFARWFMAVLVFCIAANLVPDESPVSIAAVWLAAVGVFFLMKRKARREEQRKLETGGFTFPRQAHGAEYADDEHLHKGGLI
jgi:hypothetical protein